MLIRLNHENGMFTVDPEIAGMSEMQLDALALQNALRVSTDTGALHREWIPISTGLNHGVWQRGSEMQVMLVLPPTTRAITFRTPYVEPSPAQIAAGVSTQRSKEMYEAQWAPYVTTRIVEPHITDEARIRELGHSGGQISYVVMAELPRRAWVGLLKAQTQYRNSYRIKMMPVKKRRAMPGLQPARLEYRQWVGGNVHPGGKVCWGPALQPLMDMGLSNLADADALFFDSAFNNDLMGRRRSWHSSPAHWGLSPERLIIPAGMFVGGIISDPAGAHE